MENRCFLSGSRPDALTGAVAYLVLILALLRSDRDTMVFWAVAAAIGILAIAVIVRFLLRLRLHKSAPEASEAPQRREELMWRAIRLAAYFGLLAVILRDIPVAAFVGAAVAAFLLAAVAVMALVSK